MTEDKLEKYLGCLTIVVLGAFAVILVALAAVAAVLAFMAVRGMLS